MNDEIDERIRASFGRRAAEVAGAAEGSPRDVAHAGPARRRFGGAGLVAVAAALVAVVAVGAIWQATRGDQDVRSSDDVPAAEAVGPEVNVDHWHAAFGINHCGTWLPPFPDVREDRLGVHSHDDGLIHIHAFSPEVGGANATLQRFLDQVGVAVTADAVTLPDGSELRVADGCDGRPAQLHVQVWNRWALAPPDESHRPFVVGSPASAVIADDQMAFAVAILPVDPTHAVAMTPPPSVAFLDEVDEGLGGPTGGG